MGSSSIIRWIMVVPLCLLGCSRSTPSGAHATHRDSAGIRIVETQLPVWTDSGGWVVSAEPSFQLGTAEGDTLLQFTRLRTVASLEDGEIAVAVGQPPQIRIFDRSGRFVSALGRAGEGPGEFRSLNWIQRIAGDTIVALDTQSRRITAFTPERTVAWLINIREGSGSPFPGPVRWGDGTLVLYREESNALTRVASGSERAGQTLRGTATLRRYEQSGSELNVVVQTDGVEGSVLIRGGGPAMLPAPYGRNLSYTLTDHTVLIGTQDAYEIREYDPAGVLVGLVRWQGPDLTLMPSDVQALVSEQLERVRGDPAAERSIEQFFKEVPFPPAKAAYGRLLIDTQNHLWVATATATATESADSWLVFNASRELLGAVRMPPRFDLHEVGPDYLLGRWRDEAGVEYVRIYGLTRP